VADSTFLSNNISLAIVVAVVVAVADDDDNYDGFTFSLLYNSIFQTSLFSTYLICAVLV
jgi:hypothetical protein